MLRFVVDVNGTRFHLVVGREGWLAANAAGLQRIEWDSSDSTIRLAREAFRFPDRPAETPPSLAQRRGLARDRYGNTYWIDGSGSEIRFLGHAERDSERLWSEAESPRTCPLEESFGAFTPVPDDVAAMPLNFSGLAVNDDQFLIVGLRSPGGLLVFDLHSGGPPQQLSWPANVPFDPFDIAASGCGFVILDRENRRLWRLDSEMRVLTPAGTAPLPQPPSVFVAADPNAPPLPPESMFPEISATLSAPLSSVVAPAGIGVLPDGRVLVLDVDPGQPSPIVHRYRYGVHEGSVSLAAPHGAQQPLRVQDIAVVHVPVPAVYAVDGGGNQAYLYHYFDDGASFRLELQPAYLPMRRYTGKGLASTRDAAFYHYEGDRIASLVSQPRPRYAESGWLMLPRDPDRIPAFDGKQPDCVWHRLIFDGVIPPGATVTIESHAANERRLLEGTPWQTEPRPVLRAGSEFPFHSPKLCGPSGQAGSWETVFQRAKGRFLQLRVTLHGTGRNSPRIQALRAYYPRFSYLNEYLPAVYREDTQSASFLDRYLANVEGFYTDLEARIENVQGYFDTRTVPSAYLEWLASWMGVALDVSWTERTKRLFLANAYRIFVERGTRYGLLRALRLALESCVDQAFFDKPPDQNAPFSVRVVESFLTRRAAGVAAGDPTEVTGPGVTVVSDWSPSLGALPLEQRFRSFLVETYTDIAVLNEAWGTNYVSFDDPNLRLTAVQPAGATRAADWRRFLREGIGFTYAPVMDSDLPEFERFLSSRYRQASDLNAAYGLSGAAALTTFSETGPKYWQPALKNQLPPGTRALRDWIQFVSIALPSLRRAHLFTVLVPVTISETPDQQIRKRELARRIARSEKPAHTDFDVKLYWAMFRVGEARVGLETVLGLGSRSTAITLGQSYLASGHLGFTEPWNVTRGPVLGRDEVTADPVRLT